MRSFRDRWSRVFSAISNALARGLRQRITRSGVAYLRHADRIALAAFLSANNLLFLILAAMFSTFLVSGFVSRLGLAGLELDLFYPSIFPPAAKSAPAFG